MSTGDENKAGLVPSASAALSRAGASSLVRRGIQDLLARAGAGGWYEKGSSFWDQERYEEAAECFRRVLELDPTHYGANTSLGVLYRRGMGVEQSYEEAANRFRISAEQGFALAQLFLGDAYADGEGVQQDYSQAAFWYDRAAGKGTQSRGISLGRLTIRAGVCRRTLLRPRVGFVRPPSKAMLTPNMP